jgi:hypothetical protein
MIIGFIVNLYSVINKPRRYAGNVWNFNKHSFSYRCTTKKERKNLNIRLDKSINTLDVWTVSVKGVHLLFHHGKCDGEGDPWGGCSREKKC